MESLKNEIVDVKPVDEFGTNLVSFDYLNKQGELRTRKVKFFSYTKNKNGYLFSGLDCEAKQIRKFYFDKITSDVITFLETPYESKLYLTKVKWFFRITELLPDSNSTEDNELIVFGNLEDLEENQQNGLSKEQEQEIVIELKSEGVVFHNTNLTFENKEQEQALEVQNNSEENVKLYILGHTLEEKEVIKKLLGFDSGNEIKVNDVVYTLCSCEDLDISPSIQRKVIITPKEMKINFNSEYGEGKFIENLYHLEFYNFLKEEKEKELRKNKKVLFLFKKDFVNECFQNMVKEHVKANSLNGVPFEKIDFEEKYNLIDLASKINTFLLKYEKVFFLGDDSLEDKEKLSPALEDKFKYLDLMDIFHVNF